MMQGLPERCAAVDRCVQQAVRVEEVHIRGAQGASQARGVAERPGTANRESGDRDWRPRLEIFGRGGFREAKDAHAHFPREGLSEALRARKDAAADAREKGRDEADLHAAARVSR